MKGDGSISMQGWDDSNHVRKAGKENNLDYERVDSDSFETM